MWGIYFLLTGRFCPFLLHSKKIWIFSKKISDNGFLNLITLIAGGVAEKEGADVTVHLPL
jgi:hypothetical protein